MWAAGPRCARAGRGGSGRCFYQQGFEVAGEAAARYVSSPVSAGTTLPPPRLPPGQRKRRWKKCPYSGAGGTQGHGHPPSAATPVTKSSSSWIYRQDFPLYRQSFSQFLTFLPHIEAKTPSTGCSRAASTQAAALRPPTATTLGTQMPLTPYTGTDEGVSTLRRSQTLHFLAGPRLGLTSRVGGRRGGKPSPS